MLYVTLSVTRIGILHMRITPLLTTSQTATCLREAILVRPFQPDLQVKIWRQASLLSCIAAVGIRGLRMCC